MVLGLNRRDHLRDQILSDFETVPSNYCLHLLPDIGNHQILRISTTFAT